MGKTDNTGLSLNKKGQKAARGDTKAIHKHKNPQLGYAQHNQLMASLNASFDTLNTSVESQESEIIDLVEAPLAGPSPQPSVPLWLHGAPVGSIPEDPLHGNFNQPPSPPPQQQNRKKRARETPPRCW
jgi:hypothetical protein